MLTFLFYLIVSREQVFVKKEDMKKHEKKEFSYEKMEQYA